MAITISNSYCKICSLLIEDIVKAMRYGCTKCGGRKFSSKLEQQKNKKNINIEVSSNTNPKNNEVAIHVHSKGSFSINLDALTKRSSNIEPIIIEDKDGIMNIVLDPDE